MWVDLTGSYEWTQELGPGQTSPFMGPSEAGLLAGGQGTETHDNMIY